MTRNSRTPLRTKFLAGFPLLILAFILLLFFHDIVFLGKTLSTSTLLPGTTPQGPYGFSGHRPGVPFSFDIAGNAWVNEPSPYVIKRVLNEGSLPVWNPYEGLGMPLIANMNSEVFNPLKLFLNLFPHPFSQDIFFLLRLLVMGFFTYLFLREMKLSSFACLFGAVFFMLSGYSVWWINLHPLSTVMYLPAVFYFYEKWNEREDARNLFFMSLCLSLALIAGKIPDVIMGLALLLLYGIWKGAVRNLFKGMLKEGGKIIIATVFGILMASIALIPFIELYSNASPIARAIRTGAAGHTIPLITSVSLFQPLFFGWKNYFYESWLKWTPDIILPHASMVVMLLLFYSMFRLSILKKTFPYIIFSLFLFLTVYGLVPFHAVSRLPVLRSIEFLKYNAMFYFALAIVSAHAFEDLLSAGENRRGLNVSIAIVSLLVLAYFSLLYGESPPQMKGYMIAILLLSLSGLLIIGLTYHFPKIRKAFGIVIFLLLMFELFLYMPADHPDRGNPYREPSYLKVVREREPYRITGDGSSVPPLVSAAVGLYDIRAISVLMPGNYYMFFENLMGFSLPGTNSPNPLFTATSPLIDLTGVRYIMTSEPLDRSRLQEAVSSHIGFLRPVRFLGSMINHSIEGGMAYGFFNPGSENRFSLFFPMRFAFETKLRVSEPFIFSGFALKDSLKDTSAKIRISVEKKVTELIIQEGKWKDQWLDVTDYFGKVITVRIEGSGSAVGRIVLGDFGLSPGYEKEGILYSNLLALHKRELDFLKYIGIHEGMHVYKNENVMERAFVLHGRETAEDLGEVIQDLQKGVCFRDIALVPSSIPPLHTRKSETGLSRSQGEGKDKTDMVAIKSYTPDSVGIDVESEGGLLVLSDLYYPGWRVSVNGRESRIIKVFGLLRGVEIGRGRSEVLFSYRPISLYVGSVISAVALTVCFIISRRKKLH